ncbi:MAG: D-tyrosyl-tRNA(Tyr) deacylase [Clostridiales bacterium]|nr:D-tyrosyl-tRNA(Tyr) deacylase [Clostridiales bacterium]
MRAVIQRVKEASVTVDGKVISKIQKGLLVLVGITHNDCEKDADYIAEKIVSARIFADSEDKMNLSVKDVGGDILVVSQFTLYGDIRKGRRPSFINAAKGDVSEPLYELVCEKINKMGFCVKKGIFGADMLVEIQNDGPVTLLLESDRSF